MFTKVLIANRGEIACRVIRTCKRLGIETVAIYSDADANAQHVKLADQAFALGSSESKTSYLDIDKVVRIAKKAKVDAIHPGYGFLSENPEFARRLSKEKITFIGPSAKVMESLGDKIEAKKLAYEHKVPLVPGLLCESTKPTALFEEIKNFAQKAGYPILIKAAAGGGGRGMRRVNKASELQDALLAAQREAEAAFGDSRIFVEKLIEKARHIEVQIFGDTHGNVVSLFDRDCSMQRNHQKVIEEAPAPLISDKVRSRIHESARRLCKAAKYQNAGTVEFLLTPEEDFYFLEVNSRLQVEHPVTEAITGLDLVELQLRIAHGEKLDTLAPQKSITCSGAAIELRLCAEIPENNFIASTGVIEKFELAAPLDGGHYRLDTGFVVGDKISHYYDSMIAKLIVHRPTRSEAVAALLSILDRSMLAGVRSNISFLRTLLVTPEFKAVTHSTRFSHSVLPSQQDLCALNELAAAFYACFKLAQPSTTATPWNQNSGWRVFGSSTHSESFSVNGQIVALSLTRCTSSGDTQFIVSTEHHKEKTVTIQTCGTEHALLTIGKESFACQVTCQESGIWLSFAQGIFNLKPHRPALKQASGKKANGNELVISPLPGKIVALKTQVGAQVKSGDPLLVLESMKMEHIIRATADSNVAEIFVHAGEVVEAQGKLVQLASV
jgi:3-methylcrotonyl-CoA carboxylase alpha subunit